MVFKKLRMLDDAFKFLRHICDEENYLQDLLGQLSTVLKDSFVQEDDSSVDGASTSTGAASSPPPSPRATLAPAPTASSHRVRDLSAEFEVAHFCLFQDDHDEGREPASTSVCAMLPAVSEAPIEHEGNEDDVSSTPGSSGDSMLLLSAAQVGSPCPLIDDDHLQWLDAWKLRFASAVPPVDSYRSMITELQLQTEIWVDVDLMTEAYGILDSESDDDE